MEASRLPVEERVGRADLVAGTVSRVRGALRDDVPFLATIGAYVVAVAFLHGLTGIPRRYDLSGDYSVVLGWVGLYAFPAFIGYVVYRFFAKKESLLDSRLWRRVGSRMVSSGETIAFLFIFLALPYWIRSFVAMKAAIPAIVPFSWDPLFMEWDRALHFGTDPWRLLHPVLGYPAVTMTIDFVYRAWFPVMWIAFIWQAWHAPRTPLRTQFLLSFALCWILLGTVMAIAFSSAGPIYYEAVVGESGPFQPLLAYLEATAAEQPLQVLDTSEMLWTSYQDPEAAALGISAMPSLHISVVVLLAILGWKTHRWLGWAYSVFALLIFLGSIHLAWHYAIDGYVAALATGGIWVVSGKFARWWQRPLVEGTTRDA